MQHGLRWLLGSLVLLLRIIESALLVSILVVAVGVALPFIPDASSYEALAVVARIYAGAVWRVKSVIPTVFGGFETVPAFLLVGIVFALRVAHTIEGALREYRDKLSVQRNFAELRGRMGFTREAVALESKMRALQSGDAKSRAELLKLFAETKKKLDAMGRDLAFLSIDVIGSTDMKVGEDKALVEHDFMAYKEFVVARLTQHRQIKAAWTPDGVMICFASADDAVGAARDIIAGLDVFNKTQKTIAKDFRVRCGVNAGLVSFDPATPMEEMSDRVIDVAGHMQKYAAANTIFLSKQCLNSLQADKDGFLPADTKVDGFEVYKWQPPAK